MFTSSRGDTLAAFAVNVPAAESDLARISPNEIESRFAAERSSVLDTGGDLAEQIRQARVGREIGGRFLWAAALFLLLETAVAGGVCPVTSPVTSPSLRPGVWGDGGDWTWGDWGDWTNWSSPARPVSVPPVSVVSAWSGSPTPVTPVTSVAGT